MKNLLVLFTVCGLAVTQSTTPPPGLTYSGTYTVQANDTLASIAAAVHRGVCTIARANRMADVELMPRLGSTLLVPANDTNINDTSCLLKETTTPLLCIYGGPHVYTVVAGDTLAKVAQKLNLDVAALANSTGPPGPPPSSTSTSISTSTLTSPSSVNTSAPLDPGRGLKIPQCSPSACRVQPYRFAYGTYVDLAAAYNTTVGQILAFNPTYSFSASVDDDKAPVITLPSDCGPTADTIAVIS